MNNIESRVFRRVDFTARVVGQVVDGGPRFEGVSANISDGGVLVTANVELPVSSLARLEFEGRALDAPLSITAVARWVKPCGDGSCSIGFEFCDDESGLDAVRALVERLAPTAWADGGPGTVSRAVAVQFGPIVRRMARSLSRMVPVHVDDLIAAGFLGLVEAQRTYRPELNPSFEAFARLRIRGAMMDEARSVDTLSRRQRAVGKVISRARAELLARTGSEPTPQQVAAVAGLAQDVVEEHRLAALAQQRASEEDLSGLADMQSTPEATTMRAEGIENVKTALSALPERLRQILEMYYGHEMTLRSIASVVGVSEARVSQLHADAIRRLRERCNVV